jgi:hypothetical protein
MDDWATRSGTSAVRPEFRLFFKYLRDRHADIVVLTFAQIEDLLDSPLPAEARVQAAWWTARAESTSSYAEAWTAANRTAVPNLLARTVRFERVAA